MFFSFKSFKNYRSTSLVGNTNKGKSVMKKIIRLMLVPMLMILAAPAYSAPVSMFLKCGQDDEASRKDLETVASKWLKAAKGMKGGENLELYLHFPVVAQMGEYDFAFVLVAPSATDWGTFVDGYEGSAEIQKLDKEWDELASCPDSALWKTIKID